VQWREKEGKNQRGGRGRRTASESTKDAIGVCELRWRNFVAWQRFWFGKKGRRQKKGWGLYRGGWHGEGARVSSGATRLTARASSVLGRDSSQRKREMLTCEPRMSARGERGSDTLSGFACWVVGRIWGWAGMAPQSLFALFFVLLIFFFLISYLFKTFS
jgi:hypothetical protein